MGKGVGSFLRWVIKLPKGFVFLKISGLHLNQLKKAIKVLNKLLGVKTTIYNHNKFI